MAGGFVRGALVVAVLVGMGARADTATAEGTPAQVPPAAVAPPVTPPSQDHSSPGEEPDEDEDAPSLRVFGRFFARAAADEREDYQRQLGIASARLGVRASFAFADAEVEADLAEAQMLRDAYVRLRDPSKRFRLYGGRFKAPFFARALESSWDLPRIRKGLVESLLVDEHQLGGRRFGAMGEVKLKTLDTRLELGVFEGAKLPDGTRTSEDVAGRASIEPFGGLTVAVNGYLAEAFDQRLRVAGGSDLTFELGGLAVKLEGLWGRLAIAAFTSELAMVTYDLRLGRTWTLQPVLSGEAIQLTGEGAGRGWAAGAGANLLYRDLFRLQLQVERAIRPGDGAPANDLALQLGVRF